MDLNLRSSQNASFDLTDSPLPDSIVSGYSDSSSSSTDNKCTVKVLSANHAGSRAQHKNKIFDNVIKSGERFNGELQSRRKHYMAISQLIGVKTVKAILSTKEITMKVNSFPGQNAEDLSLSLEANSKLHFSLCVHENNTILCLDLPKTAIKELVFVCRVKSLPGFERASGADPGFSEWTLNIKVVPKDSGTSTPRKPRKISPPASDNSQIDESTCSSPSEKTVRSPSLRVRKVLVLVPSVHPRYFDCVCASLEKQKFKLQKTSKDMAHFTMSTAQDIGERVTVIKYSLELHRDIESIASHTDYVLLMTIGEGENEVTKPHVVSQVDGLKLTSGVPNNFSVYPVKKSSSFGMLEGNIINNIMKTGSTLWLVPNQFEATVISKALHLTLTSYPLRPCSQDLFTCWTFKGADLNDADCQQKVTGLLSDKDPGLSQVENTFHCCVAVIVRSDMWLWHLIGMMDDSDFLPLGPAFKSVHQIDVRDVKKFFNNPENDIYLDELTELEQRIQFSAYPVVEHKLRRDVQNDSRVQIPLKRSCESIDDPVTKKPRTDTQTPTHEHAHDRNLFTENRHELASPKDPIDRMTSRQALEYCDDILKGYLRAIAPKDFYLLALAQYFLKLAHERFYPEYQAEVCAFAALAFALSPKHPSYPLLRFSRSDIKDVLLVKECTTFGRKDCDILFRGEKRISAKHCIIKRIDDLFVMEDTSSNGTFLDGDATPISKQKLVTLSNGMHITFIEPDNECVGFKFYIQDYNEQGAKEYMQNLERIARLSSYNAAVAQIMTGLALICSASPRRKQILIHVGKHHSPPSYDDETSQEIPSMLNRSLSDFSQ